jgi:WD40 repeat protein
MKPVWLAAAAATFFIVFSTRMAAGDLPPGVLSIAYSKEKGLVAAAYRGGQVVIWDFATGRAKSVYNASPPKDTLSRPLVHFSAGGRRMAFTQEGDAGLISYDTDTGASTVLVPRRLLVKGIAAFSWSHQSDSMLVAIGHEIFLINAQGHTQWQRRPEQRALITDVAWHPSEEYYTMATEEGAISTWDAASGRVISSSKLETGGHPGAVKVGWANEDTLVASVRGVNLAVLDPETLKPGKTTACNCQDFAWSPGGKQIFAWSPPNVVLFGESGQRAGEVRTPFDGDGPIVWAGEGRLLTAISGSGVVLRDSRSGKVMRTFGETTVAGSAN